MQLLLQIGKKFPEITGPMSDAFAAELEVAMHSDGFTELVLDFQGTKTISSMAMGSIYSTSEKLRQDGKQLRIINANEKVSHLLRMVNMLDLLS